MADQLIIQERAVFQKEFEVEKAKLDKALKMDLIDKTEYDSKIERSNKKLVNFVAIRKIEKQYEMELISEKEKNEKIERLM